MKADKLDERRQRCRKVNALLMVIACRGRKFFQSREGRFAYMEVDDRGRIWFISEWKGERVYTHRTGRWRGFHHGGTMKWLIEAFRDFIMTGTRINPFHFGPWREDYCGGDLWGYGDEAMANIRVMARVLDVTPTHDEWREMKEAKSA